MPSFFDVFVSQWPDRKPPKERLFELADVLCDQAGLPPAPLQQEEKKGKDDPVCRVVWDGIHVDWFHRIFMKQPEIELMMKQGCRMWFLRNFAIQRILLRRGGSPGPMIDQLDLFHPDASAARSTAEDIPSKGKPSTFVSFTGSYTIRHFASLLQHQSLKGHFVWVDSFCVDQFAWTERKDEEMIRFKKSFSASLREKITGIGRTALMLDQWDHLMSTLGQVWVIWEIFCTADSSPSVDLVLVLHDSQYERFVRECFDTVNDRVIKSLATIDARKASALMEHDKRILLQEMERGSGVRAVNKCVCDRMREWFIENGTRLMAKRRNELGNDHPSTLWVIHSLAMLYEAQGDYESATRLLEEAVAGRREKLGNSHHETLTSVNALAGTYYWQGNYTAAAPLLLESISGIQQTLGSLHPDAITASSNLAVLLDQLNRNEAETMYRHVLAARRVHLGNNHRDTLSSINNLGYYLFSRGRYDEATDLYEEALAGRRRHLGNLHPDTLVSITNYAGLLHTMGKYQQAGSPYDEVTQGRSEQLGDQHPDVLAARSNRALLLYEEGDYTAAEAVLRSVLQESRTAPGLGDRHPDTLDAMNNLAGVLESLSNYEEALHLYREALSGREQTFGDSHPATLESMHNLGYLHKRLRNYDDAEALYRRALDGRRNILGNTHKSTLTSINCMASLLDDTGRSEEALPMYREALTGRRQSLGDQHPDTLTSVNNLAVFQAKQGSHGQTEAIRLFEEALVGRLQTLGTDHPKTKNSWEAYILYMHEIGKEEDAKQFMIQLIMRTN